MGVFSCFSRPKVTDGVDAGAYKVEGLDAKDGVTPAGSPGKGRRAAGSESLSGSPRKRIDYDSLVKSKQMPGNSNASGASGSVELANARALVRALARKPESRYLSATTPSCATIDMPAECTHFFCFCEQRAPHCPSMHDPSCFCSWQLMTCTCAPGDSHYWRVPVPSSHVTLYMTRMAPDCRRHVSKLLILDGREKLEMWWVEEGYLTDLSSVLLVSPFRLRIGPLLFPHRRAKTCCKAVRQVTGFGDSTEASQHRSQDISGCPPACLPVESGSMGKCSPKAHTHGQEAHLCYSHSHNADPLLKHQCGCLAWCTFPSHPTQLRRG